MKERLDKLLASTGRWSRREAKELIREGRVAVDGLSARSGEDKVDSGSSTVMVDGAALTFQTHTYLMLYKPAGVLSATEDRRQRTVLDLLPEALAQAARRQGLLRPAGLPPGRGGPGRFRPGDGPPGRDPVPPGGAGAHRGRQRSAGHFARG